MAEEADQLEDDNSFPSEDIEQKIQEVADDVLKDAMWDEQKVPMWINLINEKLMLQLMSLNKPYKYVVTVVMQQKTGAQISGAVSCFYENTTDGVQALVYPQQSRTKESGQKTLQSLITVFATKF